MRRMSRRGPGMPKNMRENPGHRSRSGVGTHSVARFAGADDRGRARLDLELVQDARDHVAHRFLAEIEVRGDLVVVEPAGEELEHLALARGEPLECAAG